MRRIPLVLAIAAALAIPGRGEASGGTALGLAVGAVKPKDIDSTLWLTGNLRLMLGEHFALEPEVGYWKKSQTGGGAEASLEDLNFGASALIIVPASRVEIFFGGGGGGHRLQGTLSGFGASASTSETKFGWHVLGGLDIMVTDSFSLFGAARYDSVQPGSSGSEDFTQQKLYAGIRLRF